MSELVSMGVDFGGTKIEAAVISRPNGGAWSRLSFFGYVPIWDVTYGHATPTNFGPDCTDGVTHCTTTDIVLQYDGVGDFPNYLFNLLAVANAVLGVETVHPSYLVPNGNTSPDHKPDGWLPGQGYTPEQLNALMTDPSNQQRFGDTLYITSARIGLPARVLAAQPASGGIFAYRVGRALARGEV